MSKKTSIKKQDKAITQEELKQQESGLHGEVENGKSSDEGFQDDVDAEVAFTPEDEDEDFDDQLDDDTEQAMDDANDDFDDDDSEEKF